MAEAIIMPQLGETVAEGKILTWFKSVGDDIKIGDRLFEVETDKVTIDVEAIVAGTLNEIKIAAGVSAKVGEVVAILGGEKSAGPTKTEAKAEAKPEAKTDTAPSLSAFEEVRTPVGNFGKAKLADGIRITPLARRLISMRGLDSEAIAKAATAKGLRKIEEKDIDALAGAAGSSASSSQSKPVQPAATPLKGRVIPLNAIRSRTADRLAENWRNIPHVYQGIEIDFTEVEVVRQRHKERFRADTGVSLTYLPFVARACCIALQAFPYANAQFDKDSLQLAQDINLGIAVDLNHNGLVVPVIHAAQDYTLSGLAKAIARQIEKARNNKLTTADLTGGTYSITNNGAFGTSFTTPIINAPQVAILSVDAIRMKPAVVGTSIVPRLMGTLGQSFDHRAFDGAYAGSFLSKLKDTIENKKWANELGDDS